MGKAKGALSSPSSSDIKREGLRKQPASHRNIRSDQAPNEHVSMESATSSIDLVTVFSDDECLKTYSGLTSLKDFNNALPSNFQERIIQGALQANGGTLPCFKCRKPLTTAWGLLTHIKRCRVSTVDTMILPRFSLTKNSAKANRSTPASKKGLNEDLPISSFEELKDEPSIWLRLNQDEKLSVLKAFFPEKVECFSITSSSSENCPTFTDYRKAIAHLDSCIRPMYFSYLEGRVDEFRRLDKKTRARYVREGMAANLQLPCLECGRCFTHQYGLIYHIERCNVDDEKAPWKCYRCSYQTTRALSHKHLRECWCVERTQTPATKCTSVEMGTLGDVDVKSAKSLSKESTDAVTANGVPNLLKSISVEDTLHAILNSQQSVLTPKRRRNTGGCKPSVSGGVIPEDSTRASITGDGKLRFKFRKADIKGGFAGLAGYPRYLGQVQKSLEQWQNEVAALPYCWRLAEIQPTVWSSCSDSSQLLLTKKESVGFRVFENSKPGNEKVIPTSCHRLRALDAVELESGNEYVTIAYCGGPISAIRVAPNSMPNGEELVAVVTYPCETTLIGKDMRNSDGLVQFWLHCSNEERSRVHMWFILKSNYGLIFDVQWLDRPRSSPDEPLIGFIALSTAQGVILIYRLDTTSLPSSSFHSENYPIVVPNPAIVLQQQKKFFHETNDENSNSFAPPIHSFAWSAKGTAQHIVGVNAAGAAIIWDLQRSLDAPHVLLDPAWSSPVTGAAFINGYEGKVKLFVKHFIHKEWSSPVTGAAFINGYEVALSFRERLVRVYDVRTYECSLEEGTVRTAGSRVSSQPRLLPGFFAFQSEYFASGDVPCNGVCFICTEAKSDGYFVLPLANRHELMTWDVTASSVNAVVASCGVDGRLLLSANGRLATIGSTMDYGFSVLKSALAISRRRISEPEKECLENLLDESENPVNDSECAEGGKNLRACPSYTTHEDTAQHLWLDISLNSDAQVRHARLDHSALDLRIESLNCVATNNSTRSVVFTGGQAGLMFIRPCVVDDTQTAFRLEDLFTAKPEPL